MNWQPAMLFVVLGLVYFGLAFLPFSIWARAQGGLPLWPATGVGLAALMLWGLRYAPAVWIADVSAYAVYTHALTTGDWAIPLVLGSLSAAQVIGAAYFLKRLGLGLDTFERANTIGLFWLATVLVTATGTLLFLLIGLSTRWITLIGPHWLLFTWAGSNSMLFELGVVIVAPPLLLWLRRPSVTEKRSRTEATLLLVAALGVCAVLVWGGRFSDIVNLPAAFACLPLAGWCAARFGQRWGSLLVAALAGSMVAGALLGYNAFAPATNPVPTTAVMQFYLLCVAAFSYLVGAYAGALRRSTEQLQAANEELDAFAYSVSHDLRAPLRSLHGYSRILLDEHASSLAPEGRHHLQMVLDSAKEMDRLVEDLLAFSRVGRQPLVRKPVEPSSIVQSALADLKSEQARPGLSLRLGDLPAVQADAAMLRQVYANLLSNAFKYSRRREHAEVDVGWEERDGKGAYFVRDNGVGFDMKYADKMFGVFQRLHRAEDYEGTGVGLAIAHRIVTRHGGRIWAQAEPDRGATFYFTIPEA